RRIAIWPDVRHVDPLHPAHLPVLHHLPAPHHPRHRHEWAEVMEAPHLFTSPFGGEVGAQRRVRGPSPRTRQAKAPSPDPRGSTSPPEGEVAQAPRPPPNSRTNPWPQ